MNKLEQAARDFCEADAAVQRERAKWRELKHAHDGEQACCSRTAVLHPDSELCEVCQAYDTAAYGCARRHRQLAKRRMLAWHARIIAKEQGAQGGSRFCKTQTCAAKEQAEAAWQNRETDCTTIHPAAEWTEANGAVLWWNSSTKIPHVGCYPGRVPVSAFTHWSRIPKVEMPGEHAGPQ